MVKDKVESKELKKVSGGMEANGDKYIVVCARCGQPYAKWPIPLSWEEADKRAARLTSSRAKCIRGGHGASEWQKKLID